MRAHRLSGIFSLLALVTLALKSLVEWKERHEY